MLSVETYVEHSGGTEFFIVHVHGAHWVRYTGGQRNVVSQANSEWKKTQAQLVRSANKTARSAGRFAGALRTSYYTHIRFVWYSLQQLACVGPSSMV